MHARVCVCVCMHACVCVCACVCVSKLTLRILIEAYAAFEQAQKLIEKSAGMRVGVFVHVRMRCLLRRHAP